MLEVAQREADRLSRFFYRLSNPSSNFRQETLHALHDIFGFERVTFWIADSNCVLTDPMFYNVDEYIMYSYQDAYHRYDPFAYRNLCRNVKRKTVLLLEDVADPADYYQNNVYYQDILRSYRYTEKMAIYLRSGGEFIGGISVLRKDTEPKFTEEDCRLATVLGNYISNQLLLRQKISDLSCERDQYRRFAEESEDGMISVDETGKVRFANPAARRAVEGIVASGYAASFDDFIGSALEKTRSARDWRAPDHFFRIGGYLVRVCVQVKGRQIRHCIVLTSESHGSRTGAGEAPRQPKQPLTSREREVLRCLLNGMTNQQIATELLIGEPTVKTHLYHIYEKYDVTSRSQLICQLK